mmetsp:Transcript_1511/g.2214  ORF Transcript_1511/g.2214 Transcript_1511/m.2214 type:complete len:141 (+) Transcript_1511:1-423(+)
MDFTQLQTKANKILKAKTDAGICKDPKTGGNLPLDKCVAWKTKTYSEQSKKLQDLLNGFYMTANGSGKTPAKIQKSEQLGPIAAPSGGRVGILVGMGLVMLSFAAVAAVTLNVVWRRVRKPEHAHQLVESSPESTSPVDA